MVVAWRLLELPMHYRDAGVVEQLVHLDLQAFVFANDVGDIRAVLYLGVTKEAQLIASPPDSSSTKTSHLPPLTYVAIEKHLRFINDK